MHSFCYHYYYNSQAVIITQALGKVPLLVGLTDAQRAKISDSVEMLPFAAGMYVHSYLHTWL